MTKALYILLLLSVLSGITYGQNISVVDSLKVKLAASKGDEKARIILELSRPYLVDSAGFTYVNQAFEEAVTDSVKGYVLYFKSFIHKNLGEIGHQGHELQKALDLLGEHDLFIQFSALTQLTGSFRNQGLYKEALETAFKKLAVSEQLNDPLKIIDATEQIGFTYDRMREYSKAIDWYNKALPLAQASGDKLRIGNVFGLLGIAYDELEQYDLALSNNFKAVEYFISANEPSYARTWYSNIGNTYIKLGELQKAEEYTLNALADSTETWRLVTLVNLGRIYTLQNRYREAQTILDSAQMILEERGPKSTLSEAYHHLYELKLKQDKYPEALEYFKKHKKIDDEIFDDTKVRQINELSFQYETHEKDKLILENESKLAQQALEIRKKNTAFYGSLSVFIFLALLVLLLYRQQKLKSLQIVQRAQLAEANIQLEAQKKLNEQRLHIARELHDNIGTYLTFMKTSLEKWQDQTDNIRVKEVVQLMKKTATELRHTVWILNNEEISLEEIVLRLRDLMQFNAQDIAMSADVIGDDQLSLDNIKATHLIRVIQEAINNALKHASPTQIDVLIYCDGHEVKFEVIDNGQGFDPSLVRSGNGIANMKYRMQQLGGVAEIDSSQAGTKVKGSFTINHQPALK